MNQQERKYLIDRIDGEAAIKRKNAESLIKKTEAVILTPHQRYQALCAGKFTINAKFGGNGWGARNFIENGLSADECINKIITFNDDKPEIVDSIKYESVINKINDEVVLIKDQIMLGSSDEALKMLQDFTNKKFW